MSRACQTCKHPERLEIDRALVQGKPILEISRNFNISGNSLTYHKENHLSRQLVQAYEKKGLAESMDLLGRIDKIITRAEQIFKRNYKRNSATGDSVALKALAEQRGTIELLAKISAYLHEARLLELQNSQEQNQQEVEEEIKAMFARLSEYELGCFVELQAKMMGEPHFVPVLIYPAPSVSIGLANPPEA